MTIEKTGEELSKVGDDVHYTIKVTNTSSADSPSLTCTVSDPLVKAFSDASATGFARPQTVEFGNYWTPFGDAVTKIIEGKSTPQAGIAEACAAMNKANKK